ncbi:MAG: 4'-phosphopantetheinyl transferase superfamily protein [Pseudoxanthomonas sp.]
MATRAIWQIGPLQVALQPHQHGQPGEPAARQWLSHWTGISNTALPLQRDERTRPQLHGALADHDIGWSHSGDGLLIGFGPGVQLGMDLEFVKPRPRALELAARFFHPQEDAWLRTLPDEECEATFLRIWCAKEAVLKAHGHGIAFGLEKLRFADHGAGLHLAECDPRLGRASDWTLRQWQAAPGYLAAAAWRPRTGD